jgi:metal-responsive CopG/Arc/MetJ family transcriptional regulator
MDTDTERVSMTLNLSKEVILILDKLKKEYGAASRARVIELLLQDLIGPED